MLQFINPSECTFLFYGITQFLKSTKLLFVEGNNSNKYIKIIIMNVTLFPSTVTGVAPYIVIGVTSLSSHHITFTELSTVAFVTYEDLGDLSAVPSDIHTVDSENSTIKGKK